MELIQWVYWQAGTSCGAALSPSGVERIDVGGRRLIAGPRLSSPWLPFPVLLGLPGGRGTRSGRGPERLFLRLFLGAEGRQAPGPISDADDALGALSVLSEYASCLGDLLEALDLPLRLLLPLPAEGALGAELAPLGGRPAQQLGDLLALFVASADLTARARGFSVARADLLTPSTARVIDEAIADYLVGPEL